jgi:uncharacterized membrane protein
VLTVRVTRCRFWHWNQRSRLYGEQVVDAAGWWEAYFDIALPVAVAVETMVTRAAAAASGAMRADVLGVTGDRRCAVGWLLKHGVVAAAANPASRLTALNINTLMRLDCRSAERPSKT